MISRVERTQEREGESCPTLHDQATSEAMPQTVWDALGLAGAWSDSQRDDEFEALDRICHESKSSPPMDEQLAWQDEIDN